jgi:hypothetical protein
MLRAAIAMPFYLLARICCALTNALGGTTFVIVPEARALPRIAGYAGSMEDDSPKGGA